MKLYELSANYRFLSDLQEREAAENEGVIPDDLSDHLDAVKEQLDDKIRNCAHAYKNIVAEAVAVGEEKKKLAAREKALTAKAEWLRAYMSNHTPKGVCYTFPTAIVKWSTSKSVELNEGVVPEDLPKMYKKITTEPRKTELKHAIQLKVPHIETYAHIATHENLSIK